MTRSQTSAPFAAALPGARRLSLLALVLRWDERYRSRAALRRLDAHLRTDIGLAPGPAAEEAARPFWRA